MAPDPTDRELLEKAAMAAGYEIARWSDDGSALLLVGIEAPWNPLTDDGDNRRLQVALRLGLVPIEGGGWDVVRYDSESCVERVLASDNDPNRAVVRAAASLGDHHD